MASLAFAAMVGIVLRSFSRYRSGEDVLLAENPKFSICVNRKEKVVRFDPRLIELFPVIKTPPRNLASLALLFPEIAEIADRVWKEDFVFRKEIQIFGSKERIFCVMRRAGRRLWIFLDPRQSEVKVIEMGKAFIANASHELRTPITIIKGFVETLQEVGDLSEEMFMSIMEKIEKSCRRMENIIKNLLILADLDRDPIIETDTVRITEFIEDAARQVIELYPHITIEQVLDHAEMEIAADRSLAEIALINLLKNAAKYAGEKAKIEVVATESGSEVEIKVIDYGIGLQKEELGRIFERFYSVDKAHSRKLGGTGLGLSIVKLIMDKHRGKVGVTSTPGSGAVFTLTFPKAMNFNFVS
ncbi:MAG: hypothetical protein A3F09_01870 [Chlamydiae bacterium RIFCSPHIGHO2_12_FULL_49_11]|nr:MAG: hypothetical protein A3F09_01870 [Chlamydiae bacterium RIFCSPHIGHO2_12_FULL_49_11]